MAISQEFIGFVDGVAAWDLSGGGRRAVLLPKALEARIVIEGQTLEARGTNDNGELVVLASCQYQTDVRLEVDYQAIGWDGLQAVLGQDDEELDVDMLLTETFTVTDNTLPGTPDDITLSNAPTDTAKVVVLDAASGALEYASSTAGSVVTISDAASIGQKVKIVYDKAPKATAAERMIAIGGSTGVKWPLLAITGLFVGCGNPMRAYMKKVNLTPNLTVAAGNGTNQQYGLVGTSQEDELGRLLRFIDVASGTA